MRAYEFIEEEIRIRLISKTDSADSIKYAKCKLLMVGNIPIIVMERLDINIPYKELPDWAKWIDTVQVGKDKKGNFKAYDYEE